MDNESLNITTELSAWRTTEVSTKSMVALLMGFISWPNLISFITRSLTSPLARKLTALAGLILASACSEQAVESFVDIQTEKNSPETSSPYGRKATFSYPEFSGQYQVATHSLLLTDPSRNETMIENTIDKRKLQIRFFYPRAPQPKNSRPEQLPVISEDAWLYLIGHQQRAGKKLRFDNYQNAQWNISISSELSSVQPDFPVLVFSHGYGYSAEYYAALCAELASKGFIIVAINHSYSANPSDIGSDKPIWAKPLNREKISEYLPIWSADQLFVIEQLSRINASQNSLFFQKLDLSRIGIFGHSYGGAASYHSASVDPRIKAVVNLDGTIFNFEGNYLTQPFAFFVSKNHHPKFDYRFASENAYLVKLAQFNHISFTDHVLWWQWDHDDYDVGLGPVDALRSIELTTELVNDFFSTHLIDKQPSWFTNENLSTSEFQVIKQS